MTDTWNARCGRQAATTTSRRGTTNGWVLIEGLVPTDDIDAAIADLARHVPDAPRSTTPTPTASASAGSGTPPDRPEGFVWPDEGPGFRPEQHIWQAQFPFPGSGALNRLCVHPASSTSPSARCSRPTSASTRSTLSAKYAGETNYEQPMHTDRNHSWLPAMSDAAVLAPRDVPLPLRRRRGQRADAPRAARREPATATPTVWGVMPQGDPELYAAELPAPGVRGSLLAYRNDVFHRGVDLTRARARPRFLLALAFKRAGQDWIGYTAHQSKSSSPRLGRVRRRSTPRELELFGFPPPGHEIWTAELARRDGGARTRNSTWIRGGDR